MNIKETAIGGRLRYHKAINIVNRLLENSNLIPMTEIFVTPIYPNGWEAIVGIMATEPRIYIYTSIDGKISLEVELCYGINLKTGAPIRKYNGKNLRISKYR